jgi:Uma2 family endonuclease
MPNVMKAELIEGVVYMPSRASMNYAGPRFDAIGFLGYYCVATPGVEGADNTTVRLDWENEPQPDALLRISPQHGGQSRDEDGFIAGPPELIAEISASSASYDLHDKFRAYQRNGVREYLVWRVWDSAIDWFWLREGRFERLPLSEEGLCRSKVFPGLWLYLPALIRDDLAQVLAVLQQGIASPEHAAFVATLRAAGGRAAC